MLAFIQQAWVGGARALATALRHCKLAVIHTLDLFCKSPSHHSCDAKGEERRVLQQGSCWWHPFSPLDPLKVCCRLIFFYWFKKDYYKFLLWDSFPFLEDDSQLCFTFA